MNTLTADIARPSEANHSQSLGRMLLNKVPEITVFFWIIKVLCTTVGETAADFLNMNLNFGLTGTSIVTGILLAIALFFQFKTKKYVPSIYWLSVVLISVFGTLVTDNLTDSMGVPLEFSTIFFSIALALTFAVWYAKEKTLSIHSIVTRQREVFYWLAILFTFALGTAVGDLVAEGLGLGYLLTGIIVSGVVAVMAVAWRMGLNSVLAFWIIYILTRPLGASLGDYLSQSTNHGGLGLGSTITSVVFLGAILAVVIYLTVTKRDVIPKTAVQEKITSKANVFMQTAVTLGILALVSGTGYHFRQASLEADVPTASAETSTRDAVSQNTTSITEPLRNEPVNSAVTQTTDSKETQKNVGSAVATPVTKPTEVTPPTVKASTLGDLSAFRVITQDTLNLVTAGKPADAKERIGDLEYEWDNAEAKLKRMDGAKWTEVDDAIDAALRQVRAVKPDTQKSESSLKALLATLN